MDIQKTERTLYYDAMRVFACFSVVFLHTASQQLYFVPYGNRGWLTLMFFDAAARFTVPVFVLISGAFFLDPERSFSLRSLFVNKISRIITSFLFWSFVYAFVDYLRGERLRTVATNFVSGNIHLWFLYMITGLYLIVPLLRKVTESQRLTKYFLIIWLVLAISLASLKLLLSYFGNHYTQWAEIITSEMGANYIAGYSGYFVLGYFLHTKDVPGKIRGILYALGAFSTAILVILVVLYSEKRGYPFYSVFDSFTPFVLLQAVSIFLFFKYHPPKFKRPFFKKTLLLLSNCSFGIYLIHVLVIDFGYQNLHIQYILTHPAISVPIFGISVILFSFLISFALKKIPFVNRYIV